MDKIQENIEKYTKEYHTTVNTISKLKQMLERAVIDKNRLEAAIAALNELKEETDEDRTDE